MRWANISFVGIKEVYAKGIFKNLSILMLERIAENLGISPGKVTFWSFKLLTNFSGAEFWGDEGRTFEPNTLLLLSTAVLDQMKNFKRICRTIGHFKLGDEC